MQEKIKPKRTGANKKLSIEELNRRWLERKPNAPLRKKGRSVWIAPRGKTS